MTDKFTVDLFCKTRDQQALCGLSSELKSILIDELDKTQSAIAKTIVKQLTSSQYRFDNVEYNKNIVFQFYSKSKDVNPGFGAGEKIPQNDIKRFTKLAKLKDWRKVLSNFYVAPFILDGLHWSSVEHFYQGSKFKCTNYNYYKQFSLDSGSELSKDPYMAKSGGGKTGKIKGKQFRPIDVQIDPNFEASGSKELAMYRGQMAKYSQNELPRQVLLLTSDAMLTHFSRGQPPVVFYNTMCIRSFLSKSLKNE